jgi:hypothetical protein
MSATDHARELGRNKREHPSCCGRPMMWQPATVCWHCQVCHRSKQLRSLWEPPIVKKH